MILRRLELKHFGRFDACSFEFRRGMNLVNGPSGSGKSTMAEAIPLVLFGARDPERYKPWGGDAGCAAALVFEEAGRTLRIERDLLSDHVSLIETDAEGHSLNRFTGRAPLREETAEGAAYRQELLRLFGLAEEELFRLGQIVEQGHAGRLGAEGAVRRLSTLLAKQDGSEQTVAPPGEDEIEAVQRRLTELERLWFDTRKALAEGSDPSGRIADLEASIEADRAVFSREERCLAPLRRELPGAAATSRPAADRRREPAADMDLEIRRLELERELAKTGLPRKMPAGLPAVLVEADEIRQEMSALQKEAAELRQQLLKRPTPSWRPAAAATLLSALVVGALAWAHSAWLTAGSVAGALVTALVWAHYLWRTGQEREARGRLKGPLQVLEERREEAQARLSGIDEKFSRLGLSPSAVEVVRMQKNLDRHLRLQRELTEVESAMGAPGMGGPGAGVDPAESLNLAGAVESAPAIAREEHASLSREAFFEAEAQLALLGESLKSREGELQDLYRQAAERESLRAALGRIEEEGEALRRREAVLAGRPVVASPAAAPSPGAKLKQLAVDVGQTLAAMTAGRYTAVRLDAAGACSLRGEDGEWHPLEHFSRGTEESFCFALRLTLGRHLSGERHLPLILDDSLTGFDPSRLTDSVKLLERLAGEQQVILLARDEALRKRANREGWHTISLATARVQKPSRSQERSDDDDGQLHLL